MILGKSDSLEKKMKNIKCEKTARRQFVFRDNQEKHMFDREFPIKFTYRKFIEGQNGQFIEFAKAVQEELGNEETLELIKKLATEFNLERGRKQAEKSPDRSLNIEDGNRGGFRNCF
jgi:hypothetical protein